MVSGKRARVTAIVCTRNRCDLLRRTLESIGAQLLGDIDFTLVVVDNGSTDATGQVVAAFAAEAGFPVMALFEPKQGLSLARNRGLDAATGDIIIFTDDDCLVAANWAHEASRCFESTLMQLVGGRVELANPADLEITIKTSAQPELLRSAHDLLGFVHGANLAFGRPLLERIGRFDPALGAGTSFSAAEDTDFVYRVFIAGFPVRYEPGFVVHHDHGRRRRSERTKLEQAYCRGTGALLAKAMLNGRSDLARPVYWSVRAALRSWRTNPSDWRLLYPTFSLLKGFVQFIAISLFRSIAH